NSPRKAPTSSTARLCLTTTTPPVAGSSHEINLRNSTQPSPAQAGPFFIPASPAPRSRRSHSSTLASPSQQSLPSSAPAASLSSHIRAGKSSPANHRDGSPRSPSSPCTAQFPPPPSAAHPPAPRNRCHAPSKAFPAWSNKLPPPASNTPHPPAAP